VQRSKSSKQKTNAAKDVAIEPWALDRYELRCRRISTENGREVDLSVHPVDKNGNTNITMPGTVICTIRECDRKVVAEIDQGIVINFDELLTAFKRAAKVLKAKPNLSPDLIKIMREVSEDRYSNTKQRRT
jgi:hypothetical protein